MVNGGGMAATRVEGLPSCMEAWKPVAIRLNFGFTTATHAQRRLKDRIDMNPTTLEALNRASSAELYHLSIVLDRLMSDPARIVQARLKLNVGQQVRFVDWKAPGAALRFRSGTVVAMKDTQIVVQDATTRTHWTLPYAAIEIPAGEPKINREPSPTPPQPRREDFRVGDRVSFEDRHLQTRIGTIVRINQKTATIDSDDGPGWRVSYALLRPVVDI